MNHKQKCNNLNICLHRSLNNSIRKQELIKIMGENSLLFKKLKEKKSDYNIASKKKSHNQSKISLSTNDDSNNLKGPKFLPRIYHKHIKNLRIPRYNSVDLQNKDKSEAYNPIEAETIVYKGRRIIMDKECEVKFKLSQNGLNLTVTNVSSSKSIIVNVPRKKSIVFIIINRLRNIGSI